MGLRWHLLVATWMGGAGIGCAADHAQMDAFVRRYVSSAIEDTELYTTVTAEVGGYPKERRRNLSPDFEVDLFEYHFNGVYEYSVVFSDGVRGSVWIYTANDTTVTLSIHE